MKKIFYLSAALCIVLAVGCIKQGKHKLEKEYWIKTIVSDFEKFEHIEAENYYDFLTDSSTFALRVVGKPYYGDSRSGQTSILIKPNVKQPILSLSNLKKGQLVEISVWQKKGDSTASLIGQVLNPIEVHSEFRTDYKSLGKSKKGWKQHFISIPISSHSDSIFVFLQSEESNTVFDDLKIYIYPVMPLNRVTTSLNILIPEKGKKKLTRYIEKSMGSRVISTKSKKYVNSHYINGSDTVEIKLKIKGDWSDHIYPNKPSYRFKLPSSSAFLGMTSFAVQHPKTRNYLSEWIMHKVADKIDVLSTKYEFINLNINGYRMGLYALEEHFEKHIIESRNRREGPILKLDEDGTWKYREKMHNDNLSHPYPDYEASIINAFHQKRISKSETLNEQFTEGKKLLQLFREGHLDIADIFDIDLLAKFYVLIEISGNYHALTWHNRRFYFNPITQKLEHIFFDAIPFPTEEKSMMRSIIENKDKESNLMMDNALLMSSAFKEKYFYYLRKYTSKTFIDQIFNENSSDLEIYHEAIISESPNYQFSESDLYQRVKFLRTDIDNLSQYWSTEIAHAESVNYWMQEQSFSPLQNAPVIKGISVNAYLDIKESHCSILVENYHVNAVKIYAIQYEINGDTIPLETMLNLNGFVSTADSKTFDLTSLPHSIFFIDENHKIRKTQIIPWSKPTGKTTLMALNEKFSEDSEFYSVSDSTVIFNKTCTINELLYIPAKYEVLIQPGTNIIFENGGGLIANNTFKCIGTASSPIQFRCKDNTSNGLTILNAKTTDISYTTFNGLSNLNYKNWRLTGAVTIYESKVTLKNIRISNNNSEDALNIVRSDFQISDLEIFNTLSDGFDADFCTGLINSSSFINTGNDCIDFSGSEVRIENIQIEQSGDKGISGGEGSTLTIIDVSISGANIGVASKDASIINGRNITVSNAGHDFAAFQKKSNYGPSEITLRGVKKVITKENILIEKGSSVSINGIQFEGTEKLDTEALYQAFQKKK